MFATTRRDHRGCALPHTPEEVAERFWARVERVDGACWMWKGAMSRNGYGNTPWRGRPASAHRVSWMLVKGDIPPGLLVCHHCDVRACVNPDHLFLGTHTDNARDMRAKGRQCKNPKNNAAHGSQHYLAKLTEDVVREIRALSARGRSQGVLARAYGVSREAVRSVIHRKTWKHVQ